MHADKKMGARGLRRRRIRKRLIGSGSRPRVSVFRSLRHIYAQVVDDTAGRTLASASSLDADVRGKIDGGNVKGAEAVGEALARKALALNIKNVVFDRGGYRYHGRVKALAEAARKEGLNF